MASRDDQGPASVRPATSFDTGRIADVLGEAFADYPWTRWTVDARDHQRRVRSLQLLALEHVGMPHGEVWVATIDGIVEAAAVWMDGRRPPPESVWPSMVDEQEQLEGDRSAAARAAEELLSPLTPAGAHRLLATVGTSSAQRRRGLGRAVLAPGIATADREGVPSYLETSSSDNVGFYAALGFAVVNSISIPNGPPVWQMRRPAAAQPPP